MHSPLYRPTGSLGSASLETNGGGQVDGTSAYFGQGTAAGSGVPGVAGVSGVSSDPGIPVAGMQRRLQSLVESSG